MRIKNQPYDKEVIVCPNCQETLSEAETQLVCSSCSDKYPFLAAGQLDLRLKRKKTYVLNFEVGNNYKIRDELVLQLPHQNKSPEVNFEKLNIPKHLDKDMLSYFPKAKTTNSLALDIGCGDTIHKDVCEKAGFKYLGLDYSSEGCPILADAHALPIKSNSIEFVLSIATLEYIQYPFIMMNEVKRVLKPGGKFIGTVSFLEPFHGHGYYHHTHLGVFNSLEYAGFKIICICPSESWTGLRAMAEMALFPNFPIALSRFIVKPLELSHLLWWKIGFFLTKSEKASKKTRLLKTTGSFMFVAEKVNE